MFEDVLLESARHSPGRQRTVSTAASVALQAALLATFVLLPLLARQIVPDVIARPLVWLPPTQTPARPIAESGTATTGPQVFIAARGLTQPSQIRRLDRSGFPKDIAPVQIGTSGSNPASLPRILDKGAGPVLPEDPATKHPRTSVLEQGVVISRVQPVYPHIAIVNRVQGPVHLNAIITAQGTLESLHVISGHPMLAQAALEAVQQWRFRPYVLNGKPIEVQTEVTVNFSLN
jgi:periplasmic protein TonB